MSYDFESLPTEEKIRLNRALDRIMVKADWAHDHIDDLNRALTDYFKTRPYQIHREEDTGKQEYVYYYLGANRFPREIGGHVGDALHNLRSALDHLVWQLVIANGGKPGTHHSFPIFEPKNGRTFATVAHDRLDGVRPETVQAIENFKPYKGGNDLLWLLHYLDIEDKHHEILTLDTAHTGNYALPSEQKSMANNWAEVMPQSSPFPFGDTVFAVDEVRILKPGDLLRRVPVSEWTPRLSFQPEVCFDAPEIAGIYPVFDTLKDMERIVVKIINDLHAFLCRPAVLFSKYYPRSPMASPV